MLPEAAAPYSKVVARADEFLSWADATAQTEFRQLLRLFDLPFIGLPFSGRARRFSRQTPAQQDQTLAEWRDSRWLLKRSGFQAFHTVLMGAFYSSKDTWGPIGYPGPPQGFHAVDTARPNGGG
jgi:hypothetical protein